MTGAAAPERNGGAAPLRLEQRSDYLGYLPRAVCNAALVVVTLNVYLFWAKTDVRRYLWSTTRIAGEPLA